MKTKRGGSASGAFFANFGASLAKSQTRLANIVEIAVESGEIPLPKGERNNGNRREKGFKRAATDLLPSCFWSCCTLNHSFSESFPFLMSGER